MPEVPGMDLLVDLWRGVNALLATIALLALATRMKLMWHTWTLRMRYLAMSLMLFLGTTVLGSIENIFQGNQFGVRTMFTTLACVWTVHALTHTPEGYTEEPSHGSSKYES